MNGCRALQSVNLCYFFSFYLYTHTNTVLFLNTAIITHAHTSAHNVCFPLNLFVFDMHTQSWPTPTPLWEKELESLVDYKTMKGDKVTPAERDWTQREWSGTEKSWLKTKPDFCLFCHVSPMRKWKTGSKLLAMGQWWPVLSHSD